MTDLSGLGLSERDEHFLRRSFEVARRAMTHGNHPFGAILVDGRGGCCWKPRTATCQPMTAQPMPSG